MLSATHLDEHGNFHREDGPAIVQDDGCEIWIYHGTLHRGNDLPAIIYPSGREEWWVNGKRHRLDGPAISYPNVYEWWVDDRNITEDYLAWCFENSLNKDRSDWTDMDFMHFRLKFV